MTTSQTSPALAAGHGHRAPTALLQATIATADPDTASATLRDWLRLPQGFGDPMLPPLGIVNETFALGSTYLELVAPSRDGSPLYSFLRHGDGGYCVALRVPDVTAVAARAAEIGAGVCFDGELDGARIVQLHPATLGLLLETDSMPAGRHWHWDAEAGPTAGAACGDLMAIEVATARPAATAAAWSAVLDLGVEGAPEPDGDPDGGGSGAGGAITVGGVEVRFVRVTARRGLVAVELAAAPGTPPQHRIIAGTEVRLVDAGSRV